MEKFHPGEHNVKDLRNQLKKHERELEKLVEELKCKKNAVDAAKDKAQLRIESDLFQSNKATYTVNGVKNWPLLRKHVYLVQEYCKKNLGGKIPAKQDMETILDKALCESDCLSLTNTYHRSKQTGSRKRGNPAKDSLERLGIDFPTSKCSGRALTPGTDDEVPSKILYTAPSNEGEEAEQLAMVLRESARHIDGSKETQIRPNQTSAFPFSYAPRLPVFPSAVDYNPMPIAIPIRHDQMMPTMAMYNPTYNSASIENSVPAAYPPCHGNSPAFPANVGPFQYYQTEYGVLPVNCGEAIVESAKQHQDTEVTSDESSKQEAASLLMNMATHYK